MNTTSGGALAALSNDIAATVDAVAPAVVAVEGRDRVGSSGFFFRPQTILTADHAVEYDELDVVFADGRTERAQLVGRDPATDIALLTVASSGPAPLPMQPADDLRVGAIAIAVARDDDGDLAATMGVVGSLGAPWRTWRGGDIDRYVRADLSLYPRFSGSPLVDAAGRIIGMNTWGLSRRQAVVVPATTIRRIVDALGTRGRVARGYLGIAMQGIALPESLGGGNAIIALGVASNGPADRGGIIVGDILTAFDGRPIHDSDDVATQLAAATVGHTAVIRVLRGGQPLELAITIGERPAGDDN